MEIRFCSKCGADAVKGEIRCPHCNAYYESSYEKQLKEETERMEKERIKEENDRKAINIIVKVVVIIFILSFLMVLVAIFVPAYIGYNAKKAAKAARETENEKYIDYYDYDYDYDYDDDYIEADEKCGFDEDEYDQFYEYSIKTLDEAVKICSDRCNFEKDGEYSDDYGDYVRYISQDDDVTYDFYTDEENYVTIYKITQSEGLSEWIMENDLYDSILQNDIAENLMDFCGYSWGDAQEYLDEIDIEVGMFEEDEKGYYYSLDLEDDKLSFMIIGFFAGK